LSGLGNGLVAIDDVVRFAGFLDRLGEGPIELNHRVEVGGDCLCLCLDIQARGLLGTREPQAQDCQQRKENKEDSSLARSAAQFRWMQ